MSALTLLRDVPFKLDGLRALGDVAVITDREADAFRRLEVVATTADSLKLVTFHSVAGFWPSLDDAAEAALFLIGQLRKTKTWRAPASGAEEFHLPKFPAHALMSVRFHGRRHGRGVETFAFAERRELAAKVLWNFDRGEIGQCLLHEDCRKDSALGQACWFERRGRERKP